MLMIALSGKVTTVVVVGRMVGVVRVGLCCEC